MCTCNNISRQFTDFLSYLISWFDDRSLDHNTYQLLITDRSSKTYKCSLQFIFSHFLALHCFTFIFIVVFLVMRTILTLGIFFDSLPLSFFSWFLVSFYYWQSILCEYPFIDCIASFDQFINLLH